MRVTNIEYSQRHQKTIEPFKFEKIIIHIITEDNNMFVVIMENAIMSHAVLSNAIYNIDKFEWPIKTLTRAKYVEFNDWKHEKIFGVRFIFDTYIVVFHTDHVSFVDLNGKITKC